PHSERRGGRRLRPSRLGCSHLRDSRPSTGRPVPGRSSPSVRLRPPSLIPQRLGRMWPVSASAYCLLRGLRSVATATIERPTTEENVNAVYCDYRFPNVAPGPDWTLTNDGCWEFNGWPWSEDR